MAPRIETTRALILAPAFLLLSALPARAQHGSGSSPATVWGPFTRPIRVIDGQVKDLVRDSQGRVLYCTSQGQVGHFVPGGVHTVLTSGPFPNELRALALTPGGDIALLDSEGNVRVLFGGQPPAVLVYTDAYMIQDASDLIVDDVGNFLIASATPSNGLRAMNWISGDGQRWGYYLVRHAPVQLASDPLTGGIVIVDATNGGNLQLVAAGNPYRPTSLLEGTTHPGISAAQSDGDLVAEADGDLYWIGGGNVWKRRRATNTTSVFAAGFGQLRAVTIAPESGFIPGDGRWSLYVAEGQNPTRIHELTGVGSPGDPIALSQGFVPGKGSKINLIYGFQVYDLTADNDGNLLVGGSNFGTTHYLKRITLSGTPSIATVATSANGLSGIIEGITVAPDDRIYALTRDGVIHRITEGPLQVSTVFSDPSGQITAGKDLALDLDGTFYVATRESWGFGKLLEVSGGVATLLTTTVESRGLAAHPAGGLYVSQWNAPGFAGTVDRYDFSSDTLDPNPGFATMNYTNDSVWGDGDVCVDANGSVYTISEDDWALIRYDPGADAFVRVGSGYRNHPSGLAIAPSTDGSGSTTGWSLYVAEFDFLFEKPSVAPPASTLVDSSLGLVVAGTLPPRYGTPRALAASPSGRTLWVSTSGGWVLEFDPLTGAVEPVAGASEGLSGDLVEILSEPAGRRVYVANRLGETWRLARGEARRSSIPRARFDLLRRESGVEATLLAGPVPETYLLQGWVIWRLPERP